MSQRQQHSTAQAQRKYILSRAYKGEFVFIIEVVVVQTIHLQNLGKANSFRTHTQVTL